MLFGVGGVRRRARKSWRRRFLDVARIGSSSEQRPAAAEPADRYR
jgi:hypothetical protein